MPRYTKSKNKSNKVDWQNAPDIDKLVKAIIKKLDLNWINTKNIHCLRSKNSSSRAYARIWGLSKVWQLALVKEPNYVIEVLSEKFDKLSSDQKHKVLIHELAHIPKNFSGSLLPHIRRRGKRNFEDRVNSMYKSFKKN